MTDRLDILQEEQVAAGGVSRYELRDWARAFGVVAGVTGSDGSFDLGLASRDPTATVLERWRTLAGVFGNGFHSFVVSRQVHGTSLDVYGRLPGGLLIRDGLDGHLTAESGVILSVSVADCIPVYLIERVSVSGHCTAHDVGRFYSHRASGGTAGRMVAYLGRPMG